VKANEARRRALERGLLARYEIIDRIRRELAELDAAQPRVKTPAEMRHDAAHDTSCVGAFARARPGS
jgi:hypothetical protein